MGTQTLSTYTSTGISLSTAGLYQTPFTITQTGTVDVASGNAVYTGVVGAILLNEGSISAPADGVYFQNGGTVTNASGGTITGTEAVRLGNGGGVVNPGFDHQSLANAGVIDGTGDGVFVRGSVSSVINTGTVSGGKSGSGMYFLGGGYISNTGTFSGSYGVHWVDDQATALTFNNTGSVFATDIGVAAGGDGNQTITNQNIIDGGFTGVILSNGGTSLDTLINTGTILSQSFGVRTDTFGNVAIFNQGTIEAGVRLQDTATNTNFILNSGSINGAVGIDVYSSEGSQTIINLGVISGTSYGIRLGTSLAGSTTIENAGTIEGAFGTAVGTQVSNAGSLTLIIDPGAVFIGSVTGAGGTLELAAGTGSLSGIGTQFINFDALIVDTGAAWTLSAANTLAGAIGVPGPYPNGAGGAGVSFQYNAYLFTAGTLTGGAGGAGSSSVPGADGGTGAQLRSGDTVVNAGTLAGGAGGYGTSNGGQGGVGAVILKASLDNVGSISGGLGGASAEVGGAGGFGVYVGGGATVTNQGRISGGAGESNGVTDYNGATGAYLAARSSLTNAASGIILGGDGGAGTFGKGGGIGLNLATQFETFAGIVTLISAASLTNFGQIIGGDGGYGNNGGDGGSAGPGVRMDELGTLANRGTIAGGSGANGGNYAGAGGYGVGLDVLATLDNLALIEGGTGGVGRVSGYGGDGVVVTHKDAVIVNQQNIAAGNGAYSLDYSGQGGEGVVLSSASTLINLGTITGGDGGKIAASGIRAGRGGDGVFIYAGAGSTLFNAGTISGGTGSSQGGDAVRFNATASGELILTPTAVFNGAVQGNAGTGDILDLEGTTSPATLSGFGAEFTGFDTLAFGSGTWLVSGDSLAFAAATLDGFSAADTLDITDFSFVADKTLELGPSDTLAIHQGAHTLDLTFTSANTGENFSVTADDTGGVVIEEVTCFLRGTSIATARGQVRVEDLEIGDRVLTLHAGPRAIKWIGTRRYDAPFCNHAKVLPIHIRAHAIADNVPARDLFVSPGHAICIDDALIHASRLVNGVSITQLSKAERIEYFHVELETHEVILAENCPAESFRGEVFRPQFQNAPDFRLRYPGGSAPEAFCLPVLESGFQLAAIQRRLRARAGLQAPAAPGVLHGYVDEIRPRGCAGWAIDLANPEIPVVLDVLCDDVVIARGIANIPRPDVATAGFGPGYCGFDIDLPAHAGGRIRVRRAVDGARLKHAAASRAAA